MDIRVKDALLYQVTILGEQKQRIFETEIHKKKLLDAAVEAADRRIRIYGYCVLDQEAVFLAGCEGEEELSEQIEVMMDLFNRKRRENDFDLTEQKKWNCKLEAFHAQELWEKVIRLHYLPVACSYPVWPEHYWWSSCQEYLGRDWIPFQIPEIPLSNREIRKEHSQWKKRHPELFRVQY